MVKEKLHSIQILRALAALLIVIAHTSPEVGWVYCYLNETNNFPNLVFGAVGVDIFFVISGFIMVYICEEYLGSMCNSLMFFLRRTLRIMPLYALATLTVIGISHIIGSQEAHTTSLAHVIRSILFIPYLAPSGSSMIPVLGCGWTLNYEMFFYFIFSLMLSFGYRFGIFLTILLIAGMVYFKNIINVPPSVGYLSNNIVIDFLFGMLIGLFYKKGWRTSDIVALILILGSIISYVFIYNANKLDPRFIFYGLPACTLVIGSVMINIFAIPNVIKKLAVFIGDSSYSIYLFHSTFMSFPRLISVETVLRLFNYSIWLYTVFLVFISVICSCLVYILIEQHLIKVTHNLFSKFKGIIIATPYFKKEQIHG